MASTSDSLPSSPSLPATAGLDSGADQEFTSHHHGHGLFLPSSSSSYLDSPFHGLLPSSPSAAVMSPSQGAAPPPHPPPPAPSSKPPKKRPRASRRPPTTVLTTDTSNFRAMVQEFTGFPAPPFVAAPPPSVRPRLLGGGVGGTSAVLPPFLLRPSPLKYTHSPAPPLPSGLLGNAPGPGAAAVTSTSSLVDALALFAKSNVMAGGAAPPTAATASSGAGSGAADQYHHHHHHGGMMGGLFNPFDDYDAAAAAAEGDKVHGGAGATGHGGFFSPLGAGDKYDDRH
ncbi:proline-rich protein 36-like [Oryza brachyantha]|uniref:proline-rich protein 36-like n=1 Tax=Oryza brachyantha TaxID=4533 RepID=UPI001ADC2757|nr:proline-rich protein 36-like [Oryza brachyantha]